MSRATPFVGECDFLFEQYDLPKIKRVPGAYPVRFDNRDVTHVDEAGVRVYSFPRGGVFTAQLEGREHRAQILGTDTSRNEIWLLDLGGAS